MPTFSYIFTKFSDKELKAIPSILKNIKENFTAEEMADKSFTAFLYDMEAKVRRNGPYSINLIKDEREDILQDMLNTPKIHYPGEVF